MEIKVKLINKIYFCILCFVIITSVSAKTETIFAIYLEYDIPDDQEFIFDENCTLALDIIYIKIDGVLIDKFDDIRDISTIGVIYQKAIGKKAKIKMNWYLNGLYYIYNDGRGILFAENKDGYYQPYTNSFRISITAKFLEIKYRVLLPSPKISDKILCNALPQDGSYTKYYTYKSVISISSND